ncbi:MAG: DoxX family membrane protein [Caldilinea sp.]|nr:DoxX family membrane protein [Caldilinea sp.]MCB0056168.1 DoxX family membrane protein [Caldilineaceae bacterium]MCB0040481.1 DoxX family membrane protein [Caldilinea sp.]MCB0066102.1 DoxX family membrane protein [Caldilineaceae bacterium]MCB0151100.1 DoxX family membrane protein [Caldilineaceae bacterium]
MENRLATPRHLTLEDRLLYKLPFAARIDRLDQRVTAWMARYGLTMMRVALGIVFFWFGALKLVPGLSPAEDLVRNTIFFIDPNLFQPILALWEMAIGLGLITGLFMRVTLLLLFLQMPGTALPIFITPDAVFTVFPFGLTIEGQYIVKNLALITAAIVLGSTVRGGRIVTQP